MSDETLLIAIAATFAAMVLAHIVTSRLTGVDSRASRMSKLGLTLAMIGVALTVLSIFIIPDRAVLPSPIASNLLVAAAVSLVVGVTLNAVVATAALARRRLLPPISVVTDHRPFTMIHRLMTASLSVVSYVVDFLLEEDASRSSERVRPILVDYGDESNDFTSSAYYSDGTIDHYPSATRDLGRH